MGLEEKEDLHSYLRMRHPFEGHDHSSSYDL